MTSFDCQIMHALGIVYLHKDASLRSASCFALVVTILRLRRSWPHFVKWSEASLTKTRSLHGNILGTQYTESLCRNQGGIDTRFCSLPLVPLAGERRVTTLLLSSHSTLTMLGVCCVSWCLMDWGWLTSTSQVYKFISQHSDYIHYPVVTGSSYCCYSPVPYGFVLWLGPS